PPAAPLGARPRSSPGGGPHGPRTRIMEAAMARRKHVNPRKHILSMAEAGKARSAPAQKPLTCAAASAAAPMPAYTSGLPLHNRQAAGIDVGSFSHWVCVDADRQLQQEFPAHT